MAPSASRLLSALLLLAALADVASAAEDLLYVWTGDDDHQQPDFLAVLEFNPTSPNYGKVVAKVDLTGPSAFGNEPHHITFSYDKKTLAGAGIFSFLFPFSARIPAQEQVFFYDTSNPRAPTFNGVTANPLKSGAADELYPLSDGTFLLSSLGTRAGTAEGAITVLSATGTILGEYPLVPPLESFDPHGITVREDLDLFITTDFIEPASALSLTQLLFGGIRYQKTIRKWRLSTKEIIGTWTVDDKAGPLTNYFIPNDPYGRIIASAVNANKIYLLDPNLNGTLGGLKYYTALDLTAAGYPNSNPHYVRLTQDGKTAVLTLNAGNKVLLLDLTNPYNIKIKDVLPLPNGANPHYADIHPDQKRVVVVDYFLDFKTYGIIHRPGDKIIHVYTFDTGKLIPDPNWPNPDFKNLFPAQGVTNPHGTAFYASGY
ncbi:hypothetical protein KFL_000220080 [Klebsormidium nitens]|uniref:Uncharacterized protein n=1 Tax=Klebsormidium nitens TaxID=105231 RepID=A0A1Y1HQV9_KLENI|nr:hypothetical protein KFL_000220080 [Klebsormidium nitens]|eukprot:GAQ78976.1 hypothetical protein KFL_000220080 [Klebsormidium nitens]